jgi:hypothetical protein
VRQFIKVELCSGGHKLIPVDSIVEVEESTEAATEDYYPNTCRIMYSLGSGSSITLEVVKHSIDQLSTILKGGI